MVNDIRYTQRRATIADGDSLSGAVDILGFRVIGIAIPTIAAGVITAQVDPDGSGTFYEVQDSDGNVNFAVSGTGGVVSYHKLPRGVIGAQIKIRSGTVAMPVAQAGGDTFILLLEVL